VPKRESNYFCKDNFLAQLDVSMGGRVAEEIFFGNEQITTGCGSDLNNATRISYGLMYNYAMGNLRSIIDPNYASDKLKGVVDNSVQTILDVK